MIEFKELIVKGGEVAVLFFELLALIMIIYAGCKGAISLFKKDDNVALDLLKGFDGAFLFVRRRDLKNDCLGGSQRADDGRRCDRDAGCVIDPDPLGNEAGAA